MSLDWQLGNNTLDENNVGVERTKVKRLEMKALVDQALAMESQLLSAKDEDSSL